MSQSSLLQKSVFILREAKARFKNLAILWSGGKDSTAVLALCREAFFNTVPFPAIHIDNGIDFPETYEFMKKIGHKWGVKLLSAKSKIKPDPISGIACCGANKTEALQKLMRREKFDGLIVSIRRDEHGIRAKERVFSPRDKSWRWNYKDQPAEIWEYASLNDKADHYRVHPILHWRETDVWKYIYKNGVPINSLYFSKNGKRFRSLGCKNCTAAVSSTVKSVPDILKELDENFISERAGREQDKEKQRVMERLRALGYM